MRLQDKIALVTGGGRSIGRAISLGFAREGADVAVNYVRDASAAESVVEEIRSMGRRAVPVQADVSNSGEVRAMVGRVLAELGRIDVLVNNAGVNSKYSFLDLPEEEWDLVHRVDLKGAFLVGQEVARQMVKQGGGAIINITSISTQVAQWNNSHYAAAKTGIASLTRSMALELAQYGIRVNSIEPGTTETDLNRERLAAADVRGAMIEKMRLGRFGQPRDIVGAALFLASEESSFVTGWAIRVDGGQTLTY